MTTPTTPADQPAQLASTEALVDAASESPPREILVGVDGGDVSLGAVRWAAHEAVRRNAPLRIVHVADYLGRPDASGAPSPELPRARRITAKAYTVARHTEHAVRATTDVLAGDPSTMLLEAAADAQLVVLGSSTTGAASEMVFASVAVRVSAQSTEPVVIVPREKGRSAAGRPVVAVLGVGAPEDDDAVAAVAAEAARSMGEPLLLLTTRPSRAGDDPAVALGHWRRRLPGVRLELAELPDASPSQLLAAACPSPLLVVDAGHGGMLHRSSLDGPHRWLLRHCTSPLAFVPTGRRIDLAEPEPEPEDAEAG
jgi:nucleotide-binding universal stress UspA family protein